MNVFWFAIVAPDFNRFDDLMKGNFTIFGGQQLAMTLTIVSGLLGSDEGFSFYFSRRLLLL
ncbi:MAG TPA: hypothetical protein DCY88_34905 [Cyanobacteria bacterium UBA11372]|nr:hypothetical protein [Cyanobacteria bacterium UBA11372]